MAKDDKKKGDMQPFTVGSVQPVSKGTKAKAGSGKAEKLEVNEKDFPILAGMIKNKKLSEFQNGMHEVLSAVQEAAGKGNAEDQAEAAKVQEAYAMTLALLENGKVVR